PAGTYDVSLLLEPTPPARVTVRANGRATAHFELPAHPIDLVITGSCSDVTLYGARHGERTPTVELATAVCFDSTAKLDGLAPGGYRVCLDDAADCRDITVAAMPRTQRVAF